MVSQICKGDDAMMMMVVSGAIADDDKAGLLRFRFLVFVVVQNVVIECGICFRILLHVYYVIT